MDRTAGGRVLVGRGSRRRDRRMSEAREGGKVRSADESSHPGTLFAVQMTPLTFPRQKDVPASGSVYHVDSNS